MNYQEQKVLEDTRKTLDMLQQINRDASTERLRREPEDKKPLMKDEYANENYEESLPN